MKYWIGEPPSDDPGLKVNTITELFVLDGTLAMLTGADGTKIMAAPDPTVELDEVPYVLVAVILTLITSP